MSEELTALANDLGPVSGRCSIESDRETVTRATSALRRLAAAGEQKPVAFMFWNEPDTQRHFTQLREAIGSHWSRIEPLYTTAPQPAPGWDENEMALVIQRALLDDEDFGTNASNETDLEERALWTAENIVEALRSSQSTSDAGGGVRVKPLEWNEYEREGDIDEWDAETALGTFYAIKRHAFCFMPSYDGAPIQNQGQQSPEEAKAICQADYERRIQAALSNPAAADSNASMRGLTDLERTLLIASKAAQNYIANTESELGMTLKSGDLLRAAIAKAEACVFSSTPNANDCDKQTECCDLAAKERCEDCPWPTPAAADSNASAEARYAENEAPWSEDEQFAEAAKACKARCKKYGPCEEELEGNCTECEHDAQVALRKKYPLSPDPHASDCDQQGETPCNYIGPCGWKEESPSNCPADVTVEEIAQVISRANPIHLSIAGSMARALLSAFTVGRR